MKLDELEKMAQKTAAYGVHPSGEFIYSFYTEQLQAFAKLVAEHEREACAKIAEIPDGEYEVVVACGTEPTLRRIPKYLNWQDIVKAIRARGQK
jgi:hypothetical protein